MDVVVRASVVDGFVDMDVFHAQRLVCTHLLAISPFRLSAHGHEASGWSGIACLPEGARNASTRVEVKQDWRPAKGRRSAECFHLTKLVARRRGRTRNASHEAATLANEAIVLVSTCTSAV